MISLQEVLDKSSDYECYLLKDIYLAPLVINRPCKIYGNFSVILCRDNSDIRVDCEGVEFNDLYIEFDCKRNCGKSIIQCRKNTIFNNVVVRGPIDFGICIYDDSNLPSAIDLGDFKSETENTFTVDLIVDQDCNLSCTTNAINIKPNQLRRGKNTINLRTEKIRNDVYIHAKLLLTGLVTREIILMGRSLNTAETHSEKDLTECDRRGSVLMENDYVRMLPPNVKENKLTILRKGQRYIINNLISEVKLQLAYEGKTKKIDIDGYVFLLDETGKTGKDSNLVFWGNESSEDHSVIWVNNGVESFFSIFLNKVPDSIKKLVVCYSIYGNDATETFGCVIQPYIRILMNGIEKERYYISDLNEEKTIVAVELYFHKGCWKLNCIGSGYKNGLRKICEEYGVRVAD